jgi:hypothetical protein
VYIDKAAKEKGIIVKKYDIDKRKRGSVYHWSCEFTDNTK